MTGVEPNSTSHFCPSVDDERPMERHGQAVLEIARRLAQPLFFAVKKKTKSELNARSTATPRCEGSRYSHWQAVAGYDEFTSPSAGRIYADPIANGKVCVLSTTTMTYEGIEYIFGVVGFPITEVGTAAHEYGIKYIGCRNEQAACYAAQAMGYLTRNPAVCLVVSGPGLLHTIGGLANATACNIVGGSSDVDQETHGTFQEWPQVESARLSCKHLSRPTTLQATPYHAEKAVRECMYGRPGAVYIDIPGNLVPLPPPGSLPPVQLVQNDIELISEPQKPLVIVGKGAAWSERGPTMVQQCLTKSVLPWLSTPGGKGICTDTHPSRVARDVRCDLERN
ncbi:hypothetical protein KIN20_022241 [Parelaphostrongylus tenuis]|uniref:Thiamine pyrophosphate enzyme N-terminal TPP-binding domain-containing protein n=1 Tax=Parelaphostrongylus tenuis TaxID=148309 RepID=A0AAD5QV92_PARTN|nr:hypothetical protein KIN20_022241 [Parelaphostrongylus tenuis]